MTSRRDQPARRSLNSTRPAPASSGTAAARRIGDTREPLASCSTTSRRRQDALHGSDQVPRFCSAYLERQNLQDPIIRRIHGRQYLRAAIVDAAMTRIRALILCIHASTPDQADARSWVAASDGSARSRRDDMRVVKPAHRISKSTQRKPLRSEEQLHDRSGAVIGALSTVFAYKPGDDKEALHKAGDKIVSELESRFRTAQSCRSRCRSGSRCPLSLGAGCDPAVAVCRIKPTPGYASTYTSFSNYLSRRCRLRILAGGGGRPSSAAAAARRPLR